MAKSCFFRLKANESQTSLGRKGKTVQNGQWRKWIQFLNSQLYIPAIKLNRSPKRFLLFLYLSEIILNRFSIPMTFSLPTLSCDRFLLFFLSSFVNGFFLLFFLGSFDLLWTFWIPWYPLSVITSISGWMWVLESLNSLKSCFLPLVNAVHITCRVFLSTTTCVFIVCLFFFPE